MTALNKQPSVNVKTLNFWPLPDMKFLGIEISLNQIEEPEIQLGMFWDPNIFQSDKIW